MSDVEAVHQPTEETVIVAFEAAEACQGASGCLLMAQAMCEFTRQNNYQVMETGEGRIMFSQVPKGPCQSQGQLFCQDR